LGALADAAEARRQHAIALGGRGMLPKRAKLLEQALAWAREAADPLVETRCLVSMGVTAFRLGDGDGAERALREALARAESIGHLRSIGVAACNLGNVLYRDRGQLDEAREAYARYLTTSERLGDRLGVATALHNLAVIDRTRGDLAGAEARYARSLQEIEALGDRESLPATLNGLALAMRPAGKRDDAVRHHERALSIARELGDRPGEEESLWLLADVDLDEENLERVGHRIEALRALEDASNKRAMRVAALEVRVAARSHDVKLLHGKLQTLRETLAGVGELELEEGPFEAWLDAASALADNAAESDAREALGHAIVALGGKFHDRAEELARLRVRLGDDGLTKA
jgi:tetratricopeptide (TPR) repeat protein